MVSDQAKSELEELVEDTGRSLDWAIAQYKEAMSEVEERMMEDVSDEVKREYAIGMVESDQLFKDRVGGSGQEMELEVLSIGQAGEIDGWGEDNDDVVYSYGIIFGPLGENGKMRAGQAVMINKRSSGLDLSSVMRKYHALNTMKAVYEVSESDDLNNVYVCFSCTATELTETTDLDTLPTDREKKLSSLRDAIPEASLATLEDDLSAYDDETGYTYDFGADLRRIEGKVVDCYDPDDADWGRYTIVDDSVTIDDIKGSDLFDDGDNIPGFTVWGNSYHMEYGRKTRADFYGAIESDEDGQITMNLAGIVPILPMPMDDGGGENEATKASTTEEKL